MKFNDAMENLYLGTVGASCSPFCECHSFGAYEVPCCKLVYNNVTFIMFVDNTGNIVFWEWDLSEPRMVDNNEIPEEVKESGNWRMDSWYTDDSPYNVADWYKENGWQIH